MLKRGDRYDGEFRASAVRLVSETDAWCLILAASACPTAAPVEAGRR